ncbi:hypothetical protein BGZ51_008677 [Haplosporangium sp. Z 767]|nr:hypothetical protein BGZ50_008809 [Haplosporangium sp. Z 11]KAF9190384.1 hypothetical protein BGZ51_008677 [Haplosporangium sp. Z 767]
MKINITAAFAALTVVLTVAALPADIDEPLADGMPLAVNGAEQADAASGKSAPESVALLSAVTLAAASDGTAKL